MGWLIFFMIIIVLGIGIGSSVLMRKSISEHATSRKWEIESWAQDNNYEIRAMQLKGADRGSIGPFLGKAFLGQVVYRVVVTPMGEEKRRVAWIRLGGGLTSSADEFTLIWEDEWRPPEPPLG